MSLSVLVAIVTAGISLVLAAVHFSGGTRSAALDDESQAERRFAEDFPDEPVESVRLTESRSTAFLQLGSGKVGIVQAVGGRFLTRIVTPAELIEVARPVPETVSIRLRDFTWPGGDFRFAGEAGARDVFNMLDALRERGRQETA